MSAWSLLAVPLCLGAMVLLLMGISWFEQRLLSPSSLIVYTARSRHVGPDTVEQLIVAQSEELLRGRGLVGVASHAAEDEVAKPAAAAANAARVAAAAATGATAVAATGAAKVAKAAASAAASATNQTTPAAIRP